MWFTFLLTVIVFGLLVMVSLMLAGVFPDYATNAKLNTEIVALDSRIKALDSKFLALDTRVVKIETYNESAPAAIAVAAAVAAAEAAL
jgi:hypothetical protein